MATALTFLDGEADARDVSGSASGGFRHDRATEGFTTSWKDLPIPVAGGGAVAAFKLANR